MSLKSHNIIIDSKGNKYFFNYNESAIYCKTHTTDGFTKETMLINNVYNNFLYCISPNDIIYVLCQAKNKTIFLFINDGNGWHMNEIPAIKNTYSLIPMGLYYLKDNIHIIYCNKLPISNYYDVHHIIGEKDKWQRYDICEFFSKKVHSNYSIAVIKNNYINVVCTFFDGKQVILKNYIFDITSELWNKKEIVNLQNIDIKVKLLLSNDNLYLICYSIENEVLTLFIFKKDMDFDSLFVLLDISKLKPFKGKELIISEIEKDILKILYTENNYYYLCHYNILSKKWLENPQISFDNKSSIDYVKIIKHSDSSEILYKESICNIDDNLEIKALAINVNNTEVLKKDELIKKAKPNSTSCLLEQIDILTEKISHLNERLNNMENNNYNLKELEYIESNYDDSNIMTKSTLKQSNFKEKFLKSKPISLKLNDTSLLSDNNVTAIAPLINFIDNELQKKDEEVEEKNEPVELLNSNNDIITVQKKENKLVKAIRQLLK